jgi:murein DD-endopeptidase MepM/ murein hydrolase activator NlpD
MKHLQCYNKAGGVLFMKNKIYKYLIIIAIILLAILAFYSVTAKKDTAPTNNSVKTATTTPPIKNSLAEPIANALARVTKKPFGIKVSPQNSPVQPERFSGYHTGVDFETTAEEQTIDVPIYAICDGKLILKKTVSGYGGVAVQACKINKQDITVIYGHLRLSSITPKINQTLKAGQQIAVLGTGYSKETDGERKHLHLGIHLGKTVNLLGYVQNQKDLNQWLDPLTLLK